MQGEQGQGKIASTIRRRGQTLSRRSSSLSTSRLGRNLSDFHATRITQAESRSQFTNRIPDKRSTQCAPLSYAAVDKEETDPQQTCVEVLVHNPSSSSLSSEPERQQEVNLVQSVPCAGAERVQRVQRVAGGEFGHQKSGRDKELHSSSIGGAPRMLDALPVNKPQEPPKHETVIDKPSEGTSQKTWGGSLGSIFGEDPRDT